MDSTRISDTRFRIERRSHATAWPPGSELSPWRLLLWSSPWCSAWRPRSRPSRRPPGSPSCSTSRPPSLEPQVAAFQREIQGFFRPGEITLLAPLAGDGTAAGVSRVLDRALSDSSVAAVVALGPIGSHLLAHAGEPKKPAIAATIVDAGWQGIPAEGRGQRRPQPGVRGRVVRPERDDRRLPPDDPVPPDGGPARPRAARGDSRARGQRPLSRPRRPTPTRWSSRRGARPIRSWPRCRPTPTPSTSPRSRRLARPRRRA